MILRDKKQFQRLITICGVSQRQVAEKAGYKSHTSINKLATGEATYVSADAAVRIAAYLRVGVGDLFDDDHVPARATSAP